jgi:hypothetical protein
MLILRRVIFKIHSKTHANDTCQNETITVDSFRLKLLELEFPCDDELAGDLFLGEIPTLEHLRICG